MLRSRNFLDVRLSASGIKKPSLKRAAQDCRTKAGMARAKANGIKIGRPKLGIEIRQKIMQRAKKGETPYGIAKALGIDRHTAAKYVNSVF